MTVLLQLPGADVPCAIRLVMTHAFYALLTSEAQVKLDAMLCVIVSHLP
jgi:hypothetical protein